MFIIDFLCIHLFDDGNGRMSRLLTLLLLYQNDYIVGKYISLEKLIERTKESYYDALQESSQVVEEKKDPKPDMVEELIKNHLGTITKAEIADAMPGISITTIQRILTELVKTEKITKIGNDRYTKYKWNWDK